MLNVVFMGTPDFAVPCLEKVNKNFKVLSVWTQPDRAKGRGLKVFPTPVKTKAQELGIEVFSPEKLSSDENFEIIQKQNPDVIVVVAYGKIIQKRLLDLPKHGCINVHSSLLPRWRGAAPIHRAMLAGDEVSGVTTMMLVPELDAGDILLQSETKIESTDTAQTLHDRLAEMGSKLIVETLSGLEAGSIKPIVQDESKVTYAEKLTKDMELVDPTQSVEQVDRQIRSLHPWPGSSLMLESGERLKIKKAKPAGDLNLKPNQIHDQQGRLILGCSDGCLELLEIQAEGKKKALGSDYINQLRGQKKEFPLVLRSS